MKIGDLVTLRWGEGKRAAGIITEIYHSNSSISYSEMYVSWFSDHQDSSWVRPEDLEVVSENR